MLFFGQFYRKTIEGIPVLLKLAFAAVTIFLGSLTRSSIAVL
jgi:hypothetical protein